MANNCFLNGITDFIILTLLSKHDSYMYEIVKIVSSYSKGRISLSQNTIYTAAYKLERNGLISEYSKLVGKRRTRVYYHLEPEGKKHLEELYDKYVTMVEGVNTILATLSN